MQYANNGSLLSHLDQNINKLTWKDKSQHLEKIAHYLRIIHRVGLVHCNLHGRNIVLHDNDAYYNYVKPLSRLEKESKYSSTLLPTGDFA